MNEDRSSNGSSQRSWLERIGQALRGEPQDKEDLISLLRDAEQRNLLDPEALTMIERVMQVSELRVRDIMIPRSQMVVVERDAPLEESLSIIASSGHSRFPVISDSRDEVIGILLAKDLLSYAFGGTADFNIRDVLRPASFIPESKRLNVLLNEFRASRNHMAMVVDEYGGVSGLITIEDVLEQIVGDIADEHDIDEGTFIKPHGEGRYTLKALTPIDDFNEQLGTQFSDEEFDTVGGLIVKRFGHLPKPGEEVTIDHLHFKVLHADSRRLHLIKLTVQPSANSAPSSAESHEGSVTG
ncbi:MAG: magnesium and cobalt transporter [Halothiobacillaceae bacterium]|nr:MAG: magnesium and cobalt transporter [Halothiobacillaceae bacterium]